MSNITFTATAPNGATFTRKSGTMGYTNVVMVADRGEDNWGPLSWHLTASAAFDTAKSSRCADLNVKVVDAVPTDVSGKVAPGTMFNGVDLFELKAAAAAARKAAKADAKAAEAEAEAGIEAAIGEWVAEPTVEAVAEVSKAIEAAEVAPVKAAKKAPATKAATPKQVLGQAVVDAAMAAVEANLPEGMDLTEAYEVVTKWMSYIPQVKA